MQEKIKKQSFSKEKISNEMGKTQQIKVKKNEKTLMRLDKNKLKEAMRKLKIKK